MSTHQRFERQKGDRRSAEGDLKNNDDRRNVNMNNSAAGTKNGPNVGIKRTAPGSDDDSLSSTATSSSTPHTTDSDSDESNGKAASQNKRARPSSPRKFVASRAAAFGGVAPTNACSTNSARGPGARPMNMMLQGARGTIRAAGPGLGGASPRALRASEDQGAGSRVDGMVAASRGGKREGITEVLYSADKPDMKFGHSSPGFCPSGNGAACEEGLVELARLLFEDLDESTKANLMEQTKPATSVTATGGEGAFTDGSVQGKMGGRQAQQRVVVKGQMAEAQLATSELPTKQEARTSSPVPQVVFESEVSAFGSFTSTIDKPAAPERHDVTTEVHVELPDKRTLVSQRAGSEAPERSTSVCLSGIVTASLRQHPDLRLHLSKAEETAKNARVDSAHSYAKTADAETFRRVDLIPKEERVRRLRANQTTAEHNFKRAWQAVDKANDRARARARTALADGADPRTVDVSAAAETMVAGSESCGRQVTWLESYLVRAKTFHAANVQFNAAKEVLAESNKTMANLAQSCQTAETAAAKSKTLARAALQDLRSAVLHVRAADAAWRKTTCAAVQEFKKAATVPHNGKGTNEEAERGKHFQVAKRKFSSAVDTTAVSDYDGWGASDGEVGVGNDAGERRRGEMSSAEVLLESTEEVPTQDGGESPSKRRKS